jgi:hypothetical protein
MMKVFARTRSLPCRMACVSSATSRLTRKSTVSMPISRPFASKPTDHSDASSRIDYSVSEPVDYIKPSLQDFLLLDVDFDKLMKMAAEMNVAYLQKASIFPASLPASGIIWGPNRRLMVNLVCRRFRKSLAAPINVIFLVDTGSPATYLCADAYKALMGDGQDDVPETMSLQIQSEDVVLTFLSPEHSHFSNVNVLGMDFLAEQRLSIISSFSRKEFMLKRME